MHDYKSFSKLVLRYSPELPRPKLFITYITLETSAHAVLKFCSLRVVRASVYEMQSGGHFANGTRYGVNEIEAFAGQGGKHGAIGEAFFDSPIAQSLRPLVQGKMVLDIGCGVGNWCHLAAQYGAKRVDGFDMQKDMVDLAKQATLHLNTVHIQVGDAADMPYGDNLFDVAMSLFVTCNLSPDAFAKHFKELYRVLVPGGKAVLLIPTDWCNSYLYTKVGADPANVEKDIVQTLSNLPKHPSTAQITEAFKEVDDIFVTCFAVDTQGDIFHVKSIDQLKHGQPIWKQTEVMMFPNFFYSEDSTVTHMVTAGFRIDRVENYFTEARRIAYNSTDPIVHLHKDCVENPLAFVYHISKPSTD